MSLATFDFNSNAVRTITDDQGNPWFVASDIASILGYRNAPDMTRNLDDDEKAKHSVPTTGGVQELNIITESGLYSLIMKSHKPVLDAVKKEILNKIQDHRAILKALNDFEVPDDIPDMYVYAVRNTDNGHIKLGISRDPEQRLKQLQTANSAKLELVAYRKAVNGFSDEKQLHSEHSEYHIRGEWFTKGEVV